MNTRLRSMMMQRGISTEDMANRCAVHPKSVDRWITQGRQPHKKHRWIAAQLLAVDENYLWPHANSSSSSTTAAVSNEIIQAYPNRASVPREVWLSLLGEASAHIDVLVLSGTFFAQTNPHVAAMLAERAEQGAQVRLCFGDPDGEAAMRRGEEEGIGDVMGAKIKASLSYYRSLLGKPNCEVRLHDTTLYNSIFRYDHHLLVNPHVWGQPASANPVLHLQRFDGAGGWFDGYTSSFDAVWNTAKPWS
ncbi:helix-turn-helix domain-containing protein [Streptomyces sp. NPDC004111]|uniref:helix-turn-helix domain-containing protein n=1 Tax=Streptomyces sp. NPDC004111 TaxID=3364690 RepID=UPI00367C704D